MFEAIGLSTEVVKKYFTGTSSRIEGIGLEAIAREAKMKHDLAFRPITDVDTELDPGGNYQYRVRGEYHLFNPQTIAKLQHAVRQDSYSTFQEYSALINDQTRRHMTLRGLFEFRVDPATAIALDEVEPMELD